MTPELALAAFAGFTILANLLLAFIQLRTRQADAQRTERNEREARYRQNLAGIQEAATQFLTFLVAIEDILPPSNLTTYITMGSSALAKMRGLGSVVGDERLRRNLLDFITVSEGYQDSAGKEIPDSDEVVSKRNTLVATYADIILRCNELSEHPNLTPQYSQ